MFKRETLGDAVDFLTPNLSIGVSFHDGKAVGIELPTAVEMTVVEPSRGSGRLRLRPSPSPRRPRLG